MADEILASEGGSPEKKKKTNWKKVLLIVFLSLLALAVLTLAAVGIYMNYLLDQVTPYDPANDATLPSQEAEQLVEEDPELIPVAPEDLEIPYIDDLLVPGETVEPQPEETQPVEEPVNWDNVINIMLIGQDREPGQGRQRSDSMILLTVNRSRGTITLTSFMRDQYVRIPGYKSNKMNAAYAFGGMKLLNETLETNFGVRVDGDIEVDFSNFQKVIDLLGGVDINLTSKEAKYLNDLYQWRGTAWEVSSGMNRLDGEQALAYSRIRKLDSDYRRAERQRKVISSIIQRYKSLSLPEMLDKVEDLLPLVTTNMSKSQIIGYAMEVAPMMANLELNTMRIPVDGTFRQGNVRVRAGLAAWFQYDIDFAANRKALRDIFEE